MTRGIDPALDHVPVRIMTREIDLVLMRRRIDPVLDVFTSLHYDKRNRSTFESMHKFAL